MNCEAVREMLWAYLEKETTAEEAEKIEKHLAECAACREELEAQKEMMEALAGLPDEELPEGYHAELMQKLQAEAAPNVVPFPVKKKKQPVYKQWGMIAAAVLVVVAAGGMNGMLEMRESQNAVVQEMNAVDMAAPVEASAEEMIAAEGGVMAEEVTTYTKKTNAPAADVAATHEETTAAYDMDDAAAVPEVASMTKENDQFSVVRSVEEEATDKAVLLVSDTAAAAELQKAITEAGGYEEAAEEGSIFAVIPLENYGGFVEAVEEIGTLEWTQKGKLEEGAAYRTVEIRLKMN